ncbi:MAG: sigma-70 family RNA polymerase sigma factor [Planctomycetota bacterium]
MDADETLADLERDGAWLRRTALALTNDPGIAEDAAQITWIRAWHRRSSTGGTASRGWLMQVLRNSVRGLLRDGARRSARERAAATPEGSSPDDPLRRIELQRIVLDAIESLDEPYRSTIVGRFLDGLTIEEIARRSGAPRKTVETRSRRGVERLRRALDGQRDARGIAVLAALSEGARKPETLWVTGASLGADTGLGAAVAAATVLAMVAAGAMSARGIGSTPDLLERTRADGVDHAPLVAAPESGAWQASGAGSLARVPAHAPDASAGEAPLATFVEAIDLDGGPIPGVDVTVVGPEAGDVPRSSGVRTGPSGRVALPAPPEGAVPVLVDVARGERFRAVLRPRLVAGAVARIVVAEPIGRDVRIVDPSGGPVEGARARALVDVDRLERFGTGDGVESIPRWSVAADASGDAAVATFPRHRAVEVELTADGFLPVTLPSEDLPAVVELRRASGAGAVGRVLDPLGAPVAGAWVGAGERLVRTGPDGRFSIARTSPGCEIRAAARGFQPIRCRERAWVDADGWMDLRLELRAETLRIVVDGAPRGDLLALLEGEEPFGVASLELGASTFHARVSAESLAAGRFFERFEPAVLPDGAGRASIGGLASRQYRLSIASVERAEVIASLDVVPSSAELRVPTTRRGATLSLVGRVVATGGRPVQGAEVRVGPSGVQVPPRFLRKALTDLDGAFHFEGVGGAAWIVSVSREPGGAVEATAEVDAGGARSTIAIELPTRRRARLHVTDPAFRDARLTLLDGSGDTVQMISRMGRSTVCCSSLTLGDGRTGMLEFSSRAVWVLLETRSLSVKRPIPESDASIGGDVEILHLD